MSVVGDLAIILKMKNFHLKPVGIALASKALNNRFWKILKKFSALEKFSLELHERKLQVSLRNWE